MAPSFVLPELNPAYMYVPCYNDLDFQPFPGRVKPQVCEPSGVAVHFGSFETPARVDYSGCFYWCQ
jgi:hypothetical protein